MTNDLDFVFAQLGYGSRERAQIRAAMANASVKEEPASVNGDKPRLSDLNESLQAVGTLDAKARADVLRKLRDTNVAVDDLGTAGIQAAAAGREGEALHRLRTPIQAAAAPADRPLLRQLLATLSRFGVSVRDDELIDPVLLHKQLSASRATISDRMMIKTTAAKLRLIP